jgi:hypothetical protein
MDPEIWIRERITSKEDERAWITTKQLRVRKREDEEQVHRIIASS